MKATIEIPLNISVVSERNGENTVWLAECQKLNLVAQGPTKEVAAERIVRVLKTHFYLSEKFSFDPITRSSGIDPNPESTGDFQPRLKFESQLQAA